jgi:hypothetical protein
MTSSDDATPVATLSRALVECLAPVTQILDHMARAPAAPDIPAAVAQLRRTLDDVLEPLAEEFDDVDLRHAAEIVDRATDVILSEVLLVPHPVGARGGRHRPGVAAPLGGNRAARRRRR